MKHSNSLLLASLIASSFGIAGLLAAEAEAQADVWAEGGQTSSQTKTVTVTSDGNRTIKKTVIVNNGVKETITEITDQFGNVTTNRNRGNGDAHGGGDADAHGGGDADAHGGGDADAQGGGDADAQGGDDGNHGGDGEANDGDRGPWLGVRVKEIAESIRAQLGLAAKQGVLVDAVAADSPAAKAGIREEDLLLSINGESIADSEELEEVLNRYETGTKVEVEVMTDGQRRTVQVTLEAQPEDADQPGKPPAGDVGGDAGNDGRRMQVEINGGDFDAILNNPNVPNDFKKTVREMQRRMEDFQGEHQKRARDMERKMEDFLRKHQNQPAD